MLGAPLPLAGEVDALEERGGWRNSLHWRRCMLRHPHPDPPPQAGEGAHHHCRDSDAMLQ
jgi:hypothetical protein